ncbi:major facilitator superfamily domain-containing protein [Cokeromyces recurvatus]|uniref:major facilitator superfamily domain-containing protein n=1 Tax=Cokeromyces recurvatus TaxID=90255 RepID=UPI002220ED54|nr:major facilitator superfamily domain-containing protein [Cokeromyces recurvatus]KAI7901602.1 major facilitator superfamily domain-containing protein [Cokeromyces recurvatus]
MESKPAYNLDEKIEINRANGSIILDTYSSSIHQCEEKPRKFLWWIPLQNHVHPLQFFAFIFAVFTSLALIVYIAGTQSQIIMGVLSIYSNPGDITGSLSLYSEIISVFAVVIWSMAADQVGRRGVMSASIFIMGTAIISYPHVKNVYPDMLLIRLLFSIGSSGATAMMVAMMLEIAHGKGGLVSGCIGIASGLGATFASLCLFLVPAYLTIRYKGQNRGLIYAHSAIGGTAMALSIILFFCMPKDARKRPSVNHIKGFFTKLYRGIKAAKDSRIALGYASSFFARADEIIITNFIGLWITQYYIEKGSCEVGKTCLYSLASSASLSGYAQLIALASTVFFTLASEYLPKEWAVLIAGVIGACGNFPFSFSIDPTTKLSLVFVILIAIGQYGMIISGMAMVAGDYCDPNDHAAVSATYSFIGAIGIIILSKLGGLLFDKWMKGAPFLLLGVGHCIISLMSLFVYIHHAIIKFREKRKNMNECMS